MGFQKTATGYRADDEQIAYWQSRDTCPDCGAVVAPHGKTEDGKGWRYFCQGLWASGDEPAVEWTRAI